MNCSRSGEEGEKEMRELYGSDRGSLKVELGIYHTLLVELRNEDTSAFHNFMRMLTEIKHSLRNNGYIVIYN